MCRSARGHRTRPANRKHPRDGVPDVSEIGIVCNRIGDQCQYCSDTYFSTVLPALAVRIPISGQYCALGIEMAGTKPGHDAVVAPPCEKQLMFRMAKSLEIAISKAAALPEAVQEQ